MDVHPAPLARYRRVVECFLLPPDKIEYTVQKPISLLLTRSFTLVSVELVTQVTGLATLSVAFSGRDSARGETVGYTMYGSLEGDREHFKT